MAETIPAPAPYAWTYDTDPALGAATDEFEQIDDDLSEPVCIDEVVCAFDSSETAPDILGDTVDFFSYSNITMFEGEVLTGPEQGMKEGAAAGYVPPPRRRIRIRHRKITLPKDHPRIRLKRFPVTVPG